MCCWAWFKPFLQLTNGSLRGGLPNEKPMERRGKVIRDATNEVKRERNISYLSPENQGRIASAIIFYGRTWLQLVSSRWKRSKDKSLSLSIPLFVKMKEMETTQIKVVRAGVVFTLNGNMTSKFLERENRFG